MAVSIKRIESDYTLEDVDFNFNTIEVASAEHITITIPREVVHLEGLNIVLVGTGGVTLKAGRTVIIRREGFAKPVKSVKMYERWAFMYLYQRRDFEAKKTAAEWVVYAKELDSDFTV